jgi:transcriptional regulator with XRE-family HTH domain
MQESLGKILKKIRESRHLSIEEVSERSRIPKNIVSIIEEDKLDEIKSVFYAKSFVKTYAGFLGALHEARVKEYLAMGRKGQEAVSKPTAIKHVPKTGREKISSPDKIPQIDFSPVSKYKKQILAIAAGVIVFWALSSAVGYMVKGIKNISAKKQVKAVVVKKEAPKKIEKQKPDTTVKDVKKEIVAEKIDLVEIEVSASNNTWLEITVDGELLFTGSFKKGSKDTWKAKREIKLKAGNSRALKLIVNGKPAEFSGKRGGKKEITVTKDGIKN